VRVEPEEVVWEDESDGPVIEEEPVEEEPVEEEPVEEDPEI
jgi:hypothetical protein